MFIDSLRLSQFARMRFAWSSQPSTLGATPIIIGDDQQSLGTEYYPDRSRHPAATSSGPFVMTQSFISAYETLLFRRK